MHVDGRLRVMRQLVGWREEGRTVREMLLDLSPPALQAAAARLAEAEAAAEPTRASGPAWRSAKAHTGWGDAGGWDAEVLWDTCCTIAVRQPLTEAGDRPLSTLSGGEQKRLALEVLLRSDADVLLLDEPDNYLDVPGKEWLEAALQACPKTILLISHDRQLLAAVAKRVVTLEGRTAWVHGGSFATWHDAREARLARIDEEHRRWQEERKKMHEALVEYRRRASMGSDKFASARAGDQDQDRALRGRAAHREGARPPGDHAPRRRPHRHPRDHLRAARAARPHRPVRRRGELRRARRGARSRTAPARATSSACSPASPSATRARGASAPRVVPGYFSQTHDHPELRGIDVLDVLLKRGVERGKAMAALRRYAIHGCAQQPFETLSGGQQARLQILLLELAGSTLLLLDEPTDNLDLASAEALEDALDSYVGTVVAVTHDRWFLRGFDRFLVFGRDAAVTEHLEPVFT